MVMETRCSAVHLTMRETPFLLAAKTTLAACGDDGGNTGLLATQGHATRLQTDHLTLYIPPEYFSYCTV